MRLMKQHPCDASWPPQPGSPGPVTRCSSPRMRLAGHVRRLRRPRGRVRPAVRADRQPRKGRDDDGEPRGHPPPPLRAPRRPSPTRLRLRRSSPTRSPPSLRCGPAVVRLAARRARPAAHVVLPAGRSLRAAAHDRADHGAQRQQRLLLRGQRRRLLRRGPPPARVGAIGLPLAWVASRLPHRWIRRLAYPGFSISLVLLLLTAFFGVERNGNQNWLGIGPVVIQPSEIAKLAMVIWAAHIYANKERRLGSTHEIVVPVVPGMIRPPGWWCSATTSARRWCCSRCCWARCGWSGRRDGSSR